MELKTEKCADNLVYSKIWQAPYGCRRLRFPEFLENRHTKVARLSALCTVRLYLPGNAPGFHFCQRLIRTRGHSAPGWIMSMKDLNNPVGNWTCELPPCTAVSLPTEPHICEIFSEEICIKVIINLEIQNEWIKLCVSTTAAVSDRTDSANTQSSPQLISYSAYCF